MSQLQAKQIQGMLAENGILAMITSSERGWQVEIHRGSRIYPINSAGHAREIILAKR